jgi:SAM-dependent methyltransferase
VLDVGCGNGLLAAHLRQTTGCTVVGMDVADLRAVDGDFLLFDGARFPCPNASVDFVLLSFVLHHSRDPFALGQEALRVARRGIFVFEDIPATRAQHALLAAHIVFFSWLYGISRPATLPWDCSYIDAISILQSSGHTHVTSLPTTRFKQMYPMSRQLYVCML